MLIINCVNITTLDAVAYRLFRNEISEERRRKADLFRFIDDSKRCVCAELLLRYSLFQAVGRLDEPEIVFNEFGKPYLNHIKGFSYNLSHSGKWVVIAYGRTEIGIDIEKIQTVEENIFDRYFTEEEINYIRTTVEKEHKKRFTQIWTLKESYIKYLGTGLSTELHSFSVNALEGVVRDQADGNPKGLKLKSYLFDTDYYLSVCSIEEEVRISEVTLKDLSDIYLRQPRQRAGGCLNTCPTPKGKRVVHASSR